MANLGKPTLGGFINSDQQGSRYRSAESHLLRVKHSRSAGRSVPSLSWRKFPPDLLYGADMAANRLQRICNQDLIYCCRHEAKRRSKSLRYHGLCHAGSQHPRAVLNNSDGWQSGSTTVSLGASPRSAALKALFFVHFRVCLRQRRSGGRFLQLQKRRNAT